MHQVVSSTMKYPGRRRSMCLGWVCLVGSYFLPTHSLFSGSHHETSCAFLVNVISLVLQLVVSLADPSTSPDRTNNVLCEQYCPNDWLTKSLGQPASMQASVTNICPTQCTIIKYLSLRGKDGINSVEPRPKNRNLSTLVSCAQQRVDRVVAGAFTLSHAETAQVACRPLPQRARGQGYLEQPACGFLNTGG